MKKLILITGKIGSGKSTVGHILKGEGWAILDGDQIVHDLYQPGERGALKVQTFFGDEYLKKDGSVNRKKLIQTLLKNTKKWTILNRLIHPIVADEIKRRIQKMPEKVALELQIYNERIFGDLTDQIWVIETPKSIRHKRISSKFSELETAAIEAQQEELTYPEKAFIIQNDKSVEQLAAQVKSLV